MVEPRLVLQTLFTSSSGDLLASEFPNLPNFHAKRLFTVSGVPADQIRGEHAHKECAQFLTCPVGSIEVCVDNGNSHWTFTLSPGSGSLFIPAGLWASQKYSDPSAVLVVLADMQYDEADYLRSRGDYESWMASQLW